MSRTKYDTDEEDGDGKWMQEAFKPSRKGLLHEDLGVPKDETIPKAKLNAAVKGKFGEMVRKRAQAAKNAGA